jgi:hypothetical protein
MLVGNFSESIISYKYNLPKNTYHQFCKNIYSQNGEDGIIEQLIKELEIKNGSFCEFGASDGIISSNTFNLIKNHNFSGIAIESDTDKYNKCLENYKSFDNVTVFNGMVLYNSSQYNLDKWLEKGKLDVDFDILSIDIDRDDYYVWDNMKIYNPKIIIFEVNSYRDPIFDELPSIKGDEYNIDLLELYHSYRIGLGCSFISAVKL